MLAPLTPRQAEVLEFIRRRLDGGTSPTLAEICEAFGFRSPRSAAKLVEQLERRGVIRRTRGAHRGICLVADVPRGLPLLGRIAAGNPILAPEHVESYQEVDPGLFRPRAQFLLRAQGMSMRGAHILDGDLVGIHLQPEAANGQIVAAVLPSRHGDEITLKRYYRRGRRVVLKPENPEYRPIEITAESDSQERPPVIVVGIYAGLIRRGAKA